MSKFVDLTGKTFGYLTVIERAEIQKDHRAYWKCVCKCGNVSIVPTDKLKSGNTSSCGCRGIGFKRHGLKHTRIYDTWRDMKKRCYVPSSKSYKYYGGRGITICTQWKNSFFAFYEWAMENGYRDDLEIDRIDTNGNYSPDNCRFVTKTENQRNKTTNIYITINGEKRVLSEWCLIYNINYDTAKSRVHRFRDIGKDINTETLFLPTNRYRSVRKFTSQ